MVDKQLIDCQSYQRKRADVQRKRLLPWTIDQYPNPWSEPRKCGRNFPALICDVDKLLSPEQG